MSILTRVLIVLVFLLSIVFTGYHMALYNARVNHRELAEKASEKYEKVAVEFTAEKARRKRVTSQLNIEIMKLNTLNQNIIASDAKYQEIITDRDAQIRAHKSEKKLLSQKLSKALAYSDTLAAQIASIQQDLNSARLKAQNAIDELNLLVDLAHTEEQQKIIYREAVKELKISVDSQQYQLQLKDNRLQTYIDNYGVLQDDIIPRIDAKVVGVEEDVIVINQGSLVGVQKGYSFFISRGGQFITKAIVQEVREKRCVCYVDHDYDQKDSLGIVIKVEKHDNATTKK